MKQFKAIRRAGVPLSAVETADPAATIQSCLRQLNGQGASVACIQWDILNGLTGLNPKGADLAQELSPNGPIDTGNPAEALLKLAGPGVGEDCICFWHNAPRFLTSEAVMQGVWNLRDLWKPKRCHMVLLGPVFLLPDELRQDVVVFTDPLPTAEEVRAITESIIGDAQARRKEANLPELPIKDWEKAKATESMLGLSAFGAEQALALSLDKIGIDIPGLLERRRAFISQVAGMEIRTDKMRFADIAGYDTIKGVLGRGIAGKRPYGLVLWLDELEKAMAGAGGDTSGTSQDQLGVLLTWMQDRLNEDRLSAALLVGFPGTGKSAISMAAHNEAQCESVRIDLGGAKGSLVGESERKIRQVVRTIDALCSGHVLVLATCNSVKGLNEALMSRFAFGTYFFDLPGQDENAALWKLKRARYGINADEPNPASEGWTGREIQQCAFLADSLAMPLAEAAKYISPFCRSDAAQIDALRKQACGRWISASKPGLYQLPTATNTPTAQKGRRIDL
jgi:hypothetical protein